MPIFCVHLKKPFFVSFLFSLLVGSFSALLGAVFCHGLDQFISIQSRFPFFVLTLPLCLFLSRHIENRVTLLASRMASSVSSLESEKLSIARGFLLIPLTWLSHLGGASVGREGAAVQMGRSTSGLIACVFPHFFSRLPREFIARTGMAAGFSAVFGTPCAAVAFALESFLRSDAQPSSDKQYSFFRKYDFKTLLILFWCAFFADFISTRILFVKHLQFNVDELPMSLLSYIFLILLFVGALFAAYLHRKLLDIFSSFVSLSLFKEKKFSLLPSFILVFILLLPWFLPHRNLGTSSIVLLFQSASNDLPIAPWDWLLKSIVTSFSLAVGFKGGEVTPLFAIGAMLGGSLGSLLSLPITSASAAGFVLVFSSILSVPLTGAVISFELFGLQGGAAGAVVCLLHAVTLHVYRKNRAAE